MPQHFNIPPPEANEPYAKYLMYYAQTSIGAGWNNLSGTEQSRFHALTLRLHPTPDGALPRGVNAFNTYCQIGYACVQAGGELPRTCPPLQSAPSLPDIHAEARWTPGAGLSLLLSADEAYPCAAVVAVARPIFVGTSPAPSTRFQYAGFLAPGVLGPTPFDAAAMYEDRFRVRSAGFQVGVRVVGVTAEGFSSAEQFVWVNVASGGG